MSKLELVRAGAGSGKTTDLCEAIAEAVSEGLNPARILATTFTKRAAAELKGRIQAKILIADPDKSAAQRHADRLDLAAIGTVHGVAHQLLSRYAIELGLSPRLEVLEEEAGKRTLKELLAVIPQDSWQLLSEYAARLGITGLADTILKLLAAKRGNKISDEAFLVQMATSADRVNTLLSPAGDATFEAPYERLLELVEQALSDLNALQNDTTKITNDARQDLRRLRSRRSPVWGNYLEAKKLEAGKKSGADVQLDPLRSHASRVREHPQLQADVREFSRLLAAETIRIGTQYQLHKTQRGLVDFTDLEILLLELLEDPSLADSLAADFDLVVVDEFQDTNPLQLAIFEKLRQLAPRSRWVGDPKQAIYGFRDTDPQLVNEVWEDATGVTRSELPRNYRSQRGLVQLVAALFTPLFGEEARQQPKHHAAPAGIERWILNTRKKSKDSVALACGISQLHRQGTPLRDIAVLERTNYALTNLAKALDDLRIPYLIESPGLLSTREGALAQAGLRLVADRRDSLAAAEILHLLSDPAVDTPDWIEERLQELRSQHKDPDNPTPSKPVPWQNDTRLQALEQINRSLSSPTAVVRQVIEALELPALVPGWGDPSRRCSHLDSLLRHAQEYERNAPAQGKAVTLSGLILYLEDLAAEDKDHRYPPLGHDAVTLLTYHRAKGLEWPVVILSGLDAMYEPDMWSPVVTGGGTKESSPLAGRELRSWVWPFGYYDGGFGKKRHQGSGLNDEALVAPEGQERKQREIKESQRLLYVGCTRARQKLVLAHRQQKYSWLEQLPTVDTLLDPTLDEGDHALDGVDTTLVIRKLDDSLVDSCRLPVTETENWLAAASPSEVEEVAPRFCSPSHALPEGTSATLEFVEIAGPDAVIASGASPNQYADVGEAVHHYLAALPSLRNSDDPSKIQAAERCLAAFGVTGTVSPTLLVASGERFEAWIAERFPGSQWHVEVAATGPRVGGGIWNGTMDLLLQLPGGEVVLVDHKSAPLQQSQCLAKAEQYIGQIAAYRELLAAAGEKLDSSWIHFPLAGGMVKVT